MAARVGRRASEGEPVTGRLLASFTFALVVLLTACASSEYVPRRAPVPDPASMPARGADGRLTVAADPYTDWQRQQAVFGSGLSRMGILPVQLLLENGAARRMLVRASEVALVLPDGRALLASSAFVVVARMQGALVQHQPVAQGALHMAPLAGAYFGPAAYGATGLAGVMVFIAANIVTNKPVRAPGAILADYRSKELPDVAFGPGESRHGFVYFLLPPDAPRAGNFALAARFIDVEDATVTVVRVPLPRFVAE